MTRHKALVLIGLAVLLLIALAWVRVMVLDTPGQLIDDSCLGGPLDCTPPE